jgi:hypothetical protein
MLLSYVRRRPASITQVKGALDDMGLHQAP